MKFKHNKRKNVAILFECAIREIAKAMQNNDVKTSKKVTSLLKEHIKDSLREELLLYKNLYETNLLSEKDAEKLLERSIERYSQINNSELEKKRNQFYAALSKNNENVLDNFIPNYKNIATIYQLFTQNNTVKNKILLENNIVNYLSSKPQDKQQNQLEPIDSLVLKSFIKNFNTKYKNLNENQNKLIKLYLTSSQEKNLVLKNFINEQLKEIKDSVQKYKNTKKLSEIEKENTNKILEIIENFKTIEDIEQKSLLKVLKLQELIKEINNDNNNQS